MALALTSLDLQNFRSYEEFSLRNIGALTIFLGQNAVGKTNLIEAIQLLTAINSFRNPQAGHLIREGGDFAVASGRIEGDDRRLDVTLRVSEGKKRYALNDKPKKANALKGMYPAVIFTPDDLMIVKGSNSLRRDALDDIGCQISENHRIIRRDFQTVLKNKNALLKNDPSLDMIRALNEVMVTCSSHLTCYRQALFSRMTPYLIEAYRQISQSNELLTCEYVPSWSEYSIGEKEGFSKYDAGEWLHDALERNIFQEIQRKRALVGAHNDKVNFYIDGRDASVFASQGQQRSVVLAFKIAEVAVVKDVTGMRPALLLDDVMSELDEARRNCLVEFIHNEMQVFITTTSLQYLNSELRDRAQIITIEK